MTKVTRLTLEQGGVLERRRLHLREIVDDADAPLDTVGADVKAARLRKGDDLDVISRVLKIRREHLEALENGELQSLPGRAYAIGFLRSYSEYLGLDPAACVERFKAEIAGRGEPDEPQPTFTPEEKERKLPQGWIVFVVLLLIAVVWGGYYLSVSANRMLAQEVQPVPDQIARQAGVEAAPSIQTLPRPVTPAPAPQAGAPAPATAAAPPSTTVASLPPAAATAPPVADPNLPPGTSYGLGNTNSRLTLRIYKPTRLLVQGPGGKIYINRSLKPGDTYRAPNMVGLILTAADASGVEIILDGAPVGRAGQGVVNGVSLNPQEIMDRASRGAPG
jgi:cytoskeleton protein RodZ